MTVYLGKNPVGVGRIVEKKVAKEKFGATVDAFLGDVDANGNYVAPSQPVEVNLVGVTNLPRGSFQYRFALTQEGSFIADEVISVGAYAMNHAFYSTSGTYKIKTMSFANLEVVDEDWVFEQCFYAGTEKSLVFNFPKLKVISGDYAFSKFATSYCGLVDDLFPALEEVSGTSSLDGFIAYQNRNGVPLTFSKLKKATGPATYQPAAPFGSPQTNGNVWNFPSATEFVGYLWSSGSYTGEIHFAAANQAAIEACEGYVNKWGFRNATIFFDL